MTEFIANIHFLRPLWLFAVVAVVACYWLLRKNSNRGGQWGKVLAPELLPLLLHRDDRGTVNLRPWLLLCGLLAVIALAGPSWSKKPMPVHKQEQVLIVLFDLSPSMLAADIKPDRLTRARLKTIDLLNAYREGYAALIAYAGDAHVVTPLTDDTNTIVSQLPVLHPGIMPSTGSNTEAALDMALTLAANGGHSEGDILLITDGVTVDARENLQNTLRSKPDFRLSILGVGTDEGAPIPLNEHGFARDGRGSIVIASLRSEELRGLAQRSGGVYRTLTGSDADIQALLEPVRQRAGGSVRELERSLDIWEDRGFWLVLVLLPLAALLFRRGLLAALLIAPLIHTPQSHASWWDDLWATPDQQGYRELQRDNPQGAVEHFTDPAWRGIAADRAGNHRAAAEAFSRLETADAHYNRGNALARAGELDKAIAAYDEALTLSPAMEDAAYNKSLLESLRDQQQNNQQQNGEGQNTQDSDNQQKDRSETGDGQDANASSAPEENEATPGDPGQQSADNQEDRQQESRQPGEPSQDAKGEQAQENTDGEPRQAGEETTADNPSEQPQLMDEASETPGDAAQKHAENDTSMDDAARQSAEQWLRRVPDDPGGLLRNKFDYEARQRFREERSSPRLPPGNSTLR